MNEEDIIGSKIYCKYCYRHVSYTTYTDCVPIIGFSIQIECDKCGALLTPPCSTPEEMYKFLNDHFSKYTEDYKNRDYLFEEYWHKWRSQKEIAKKLKCSQSTISKWMKLHGIEARPRDCGLHF